MAQSNLSLEEISQPPVTWILPKQFGAIMFFLMENAATLFGFPSG